MSWRETRILARQKVHDAMGYLATVTLENGMELYDIKTRWHRKQEAIGETEEGYAAYISDVDKLIFLVDDIPDCTKLKRGLNVTLDEGTKFKIEAVYPKDYPTITCEVVRL